MFLSLFAPKWENMNWQHLSVYGKRRVESVVVAVFHLPFYCSGTDNVEGTFPKRSLKLVGK